MEDNYLNQIQSLLNNNNINDSSNKVQLNLDIIEDKKTVYDAPKNKNITNNFDDMPIKGGSNFNELLEKEMSKEQNEGYINNDIDKNIEPKFKYVPKKKTDIISVPSNTKKYKYYSDNFKSKKKKKEKSKEKNDKGNFNININNIKSQKREHNYIFSGENSKKQAEKYNKSEKEIYIKESPKSQNPNKKEKKVYDNKLDFDEFKQKKINSIAKKTNMPTISNNKINKINKFNDSTKAKYNLNNNINNNNKKGRGIDDNVMDFESFKKKKNLGKNNEKNKYNFNTPWNNFNNSKKEEKEDNIENKSENSLDEFQDDNNDDIIMMKNENNKYKINENFNIKKNIKNEFHAFKEEIPPEDNSNDKNESDNENSVNNEEEEEHYTNEDYIKSVMGEGAKINDMNNNIENILDLNNKINDEENGENDLDNENNDIQNINEEEEEKKKIKQILKENTNNFENDLDKEEDSREIYKMFEEKLTQQNNLNKFNSNRDQVIQGRNIIQTKLINNNIKNIPNNNEVLNKQDMNINNEYKSYQIEQEKDNSNKKFGFVDTKISELNYQIENMKNEHLKISDTKKEYEKLLKKLRIDMDIFYKTRENDILNFERIKGEEMKKLEKERKYQIRSVNRNNQKEAQNKKEREEIEQLKIQITKLQDEMKLRDQKSKMAIDKIKKQLVETNSNNESLLEKIKTYEDLRIKNMNIKNNNKDKNKKTKTSSNNVNGIYNQNYNENQSFNDPNKNMKNITNKYGNANKSNNSNNKYQININNKNESNKNQIYQNKNININNNKKIPLNNYLNKNQIEHEDEESEEDEEINNISNKNQNIKFNNNFNNMNSYNQNNNINDFNNINNKINSTKSLPKENTNIDSDQYDITFLPKYHSPIANKSRLIKEEKTIDGKIIRDYQNRKEIIFPNIGLRKEIYEDGYQISYFKNKDIKQLYPDGKEVYLYAENHTVATKFPNGLKVCKFANGQIEKSFPDGTKNVNYADGTVRNVYSDGVEEIFFNDGSLQKVDKNGIITVTYTEGIQDTIFPDESKIRKYPDGRITKINPNGDVSEE